MEQVGQVGTSNWSGLANIPRRGLLKGHLDSQERWKDEEQVLGMLEEEGDPQNGSSHGEAGTIRDGETSCSPDVCSLLRVPSPGSCRPLINTPPPRPHPMEISGSCTDF